VTAVCDTTQRYIPTATAMPPGIHACQRLLGCSLIRTMVKIANNTAEPKAHSRAMGGNPLPVTSLAVNIHTKAVGTWYCSPGIVYTLYHHETNMVSHSAGLTLEGDS
jgi:hypothetical protein